LYRNYDGAGGEFGDTSVNSTSTDQGQLSVYGALRSSDGALTVVAINKTTTAIQTSLTLANFNPNGTAAVYTYSNANLTQIVAGTPVQVASNAVSYKFPAYSATVLVFTPASSAPAATKTSLSASSAQVTLGQAVTFTATVAPLSGSGTPTGSVTFSDGATQIGTGALNSSGVATLSTSSLGVGSHSVTAVYSGDTNFSASTSSAASVTVSALAKVGTSTSLSASATQVTSGQNITFTARVAPQSGSGAPTGTVAFLDGSSQIGVGTLSAGSAAFSSVSLSVGNHTITAAYSGDSNYAASNSAALSVTVVAPPTADYSLTMSNSSLTLAKGASGTLTITVTPQNGFKLAVGLACSGLPAGANCGFNPPSVTPAGGAVAATLTVQAPGASGTEVPSRGSFPGSANMPLFILAMGLAGLVRVNNRPVTAAARFQRTFLASAMFVGLLFTASCAGYIHQNTVQPTSYMITVTASAANGPTHTQQFTLTVTP
jgi:hypothetical protein